ncbi:hypothetical protein [Labrys neptuniae]
MVDIGSHQPSVSEPAFALTIDPVWDNGQLFYRVCKFDVTWDQETGVEERAIADIFHCDSLEIAFKLMNSSYNKTAREYSWNN